MGTIINFVPGLEADSTVAWATTVEGAHQATRGTPRTPREDPGKSLKNARNRSPEDFNGGTRILTNAGAGDHPGGPADKKPCIKNPRV